MFNKLVSQFSFRKLKIVNCKLKIPRAVRSRLGFTMIELMVVLAIVVSLSITSFVAFSNVSSGKSVKAALDEMEALVTAARRKSISQENGARWGIHAENTTSSKRMVLFSGISYASGTPSNFYSMKRNVVFTNPMASTTYDAIFDPITGFLSEKKVFTVATLKKDGIIGDLIVNTIGAVTKRYDYGLVGYWHLDEGTGTSTYDASGIGNTGTLTNGPTWQVSANCKAGMCLRFDTAAQKYVTIPDNSSTDAQTTLTLSAWIYPISSGGSDGMGTIILGSGAYYLSYNDSSNALSCYWYGTAPQGYHTTSAGTVPLNQWSHIVCAWDGTNIKEYVNGVLKNTVGVTGTGNKPGAIILGAEGVTRQFDGYIDEARIYTRALSVTEVSAMYNDLK